MVHTFSSTVHEADDFLGAQEWFHEQNWTDGLPIVPPTPNAVGEFLDAAQLPADHLVGIEPVRERALTAEKLAINAVMAGCLPDHFPVVVAAVTAMLQDPFVVHGATSSTGGCAIFTIINGPVRRQWERASKKQLHQSLSAIRMRTDSTLWKKNVVESDGATRNATNKV